MKDRRRLRKVLAIRASEPDAGYGELVGTAESAACLIAHDLLHGAGRFSILFSAVTCQFARSK
jgi:hypothetical protein